MKNLNDTQLKSDKTKKKALELQIEGMNKQYMNTILPWHKTLWQQIQRSHQQNRLPHALLLCGPQGMGKALFARCLAESLLCEQPQTEGQACGHCKTCLLLRAETHPDLLQIQPADVGKAITVDQIRALIQFSTLTTNYGHNQIIIVNPAEAMNRNAANSILKLLEEPPSSTLLMLISHQPMALLATIRSRCQRIDFSRPDKTITLTWLRKQLPSETGQTQLLLNLTTQAPLAALALAKTEGMKKRGELFNSLAELPKGKNDPVQIAKQWNQHDAAQIIQWMLSWTMDIIRYALTESKRNLINHDWSEPLQRQAKQLDLHGLFNLLDLQTETLRLITSKANIKPQGLLETLAIAWLKLKKNEKLKNVN